MSGHYLPLATLGWGLALYYLIGNLDALGKYDGMLKIPGLSLFGREIGRGRVSFVMTPACLMSRPTLLMLDEPGLGLAPLIVRDIFRTIDGLRQTGVTIRLVEQNARADLQVADYGYVLEMGELGLHGPAGTLASDPRVIDTYLGAARPAA